MSLQYSLLIYVNLLLIVEPLLAEDQHNFLKQRSDIINSEKYMKLGGNLSLDTSELKMNISLMNMKNKEISMAREINDSLAPAKHFFNAKSQIDRSEVFAFIKQMPKGAVLHVHDFSMASIMWVVKNITYMPHCYMCTDVNGDLQLHFFINPSKANTDCQWRSVSEERKSSGDPVKFDQMLYANLSLVVPDPEETYSSQNAIWKKFGAIFNSLSGLLTYVEAFKAYYLEALDEFHKDNVQYMEIRGLLPQLYELDGSTHDIFWTLRMYEELTKTYVKSHPDFIGAKLIFTTRRGDKNKKDIAEDIQNAIKMRKQFPNFFAGYDLVGQEDPGYPLIYFLDELLYPSQQNPPIDLPYFFHAGETDWQDQDVDENIIDALLLNTTRIGHGYAMAKHPVAQKIARAKSVALEVNPISNQVLGLVDDLRNHLAGPLMAQDFPLVISCDDPALWGAEALSYDFYEAFMGLGGTWSDLATLKQLAINSIQYSAMNTTEKTYAMKLWQHKWNNFINSRIV